MPAQKQEDIQTVRIPILGESTARGTSSSKDQRFVNGYFDVLKNSVTNKMIYYYTKRPGMVQNIRPPAGNATARGCISWFSNVYSCYGNKIYKNTTDMGVTLRVIGTNKVSFAYTRDTATTPYLCMTDGTDLYVINQSGNVIILNNVAITSSSVANPTVITTATAHGLTTGNKVIIRGHSGSTPSINGTQYTVTVTSPTTFTIPVNVTVGGTGGTLGIFPSPNLSQIVYFDGYLFVLKNDGSLCNCELDDPLTWDPTKFIVMIMDNGNPVGITRQNNFVYVFGDSWTQAFFNNANATGSPLNNYEPAMLQVGSASRLSIANDESNVTWVGASETGGFTVWKLNGVAQTKEIGDSTINRVLTAEGSNIFQVRGQLIRIAGHILYILTLPTASRTFVYDYDLDMWYEWAGTDGEKLPILMWEEASKVLLAQHESNGWLYTMPITATQDDGVDFAVLARFSRLDLETNNWKYVRSLSLMGDIQSSSTPVLIQYSDNDYNTLSTARTFDMVDYNPYGTNFGRFRRRAWQLSYTGSNPLRVEALQMKYRLGTD